MDNSTPVFWIWIAAVLLFVAAVTQGPDLTTASSDDVAYGYAETHVGPAKLSVGRVATRRPEAAPAVEPRAAAHYALLAAHFDLPGTTVGGCTVVAAVPAVLSPLPDDCRGPCGPPCTIRLA
jgi:hypothetical protein